MEKKRILITSEHTHSVCLLPNHLSAINVFVLRSVAMSGAQKSADSTVTITTNYCSG